MSNNDQRKDGDVLQRAPSQNMGPDYRSEEDKPAATVSTQVSHENVHVLTQTPQLIALLTYAIPLRAGPFHPVAQRLYGIIS